MNLEITNNSDLTIELKNQNIEIEILALDQNNKIIKHEALSHHKNENINQEETTKITAKNFLSTLQAPASYINVVERPEQENTPPITLTLDLFFSNTQKAESFLFGGNRSSLLTNNAFIAYQLSKYFELDRAVNCTASVILAYNSIDLRNIELCLIAEQELKNNLNLINKLLSVRHIRKDKYHLQLSMLTALWQIAIATNNNKLLIETLTKILHIAKHSDKTQSQVYGAGSFNICKSLGMLSLITHLLGKEEATKMIGDLLLLTTQQSFSSFNNDDQDRIFIHEFRITHSDLVDILILGTCDRDKNLQPWFSNHVHGLNYANLVQKILTNSIRANQGKQWLIEKFNNTMNNITKSEAELAHIQSHINKF